MAAAPTAARSSAWPSGCSGPSFARRRACWPSWTRTSTTATSASIRRQSDATRAALLALPFPEASQQRFERMAADSLAEQARIEAADTLGFEEFRRFYVAPERMVV